MRIPETCGFVVVRDGEILINTVHSHMRGAMVNYLYTEVGPVNPGATEEAIRAEFLRRQVAQAMGGSLDVYRVTLRAVEAMDCATHDLLEQPCAG